MFGEEEFFEPKSIVFTCRLKYKDRAYRLNIGHKILLHVLA